MVVWKHEYIKKNTRIYEALLKAYSEAMREVLDWDAFENILGII